MATAANLVVKIFADISDLEKNLSKGERTMLKSFDGMAEAGKKLTARVTLPLVAAAAATVKLASDAEESASKMQAVFGPATASMNRWITQIQASVPASRKELQDMTSDIQNLLVPLGVAPGKALALTQQIAVLAADLGSFNNIPVGDALERIRSGLVGQYEPLLKFGVALNATNVKQEALRLGLIHGKEELDANARAQAALSLIMKATQAAQGDAARTANSTANQMKFLQAEAKDLAISFGQVVVPAARGVVQVLRTVTTELNAISPAGKGTIVTIGAIAAAAGPAVFVIGSFAGAVLKLRAALILVSGTTALAGLATSAAVLLPLLVAIVPPLIAIGLNMKAKAEAAREAALATDRYAAAVDKLSMAELKMQSTATRGAIDALAKKKADLLVQRTTAPNNPDLGNVRGSVIWIDNEIKKIDAQMASLAPGFDAVTAKIAAMNAVASGGGGGGTGKSLSDQLSDVKDRADVVTTAIEQMKKGWAPIVGAGAAFVDTLAQAESILARVPNAMDPIAVKARGIVQDLRQILTGLPSDANALPVANPIKARPTIEGRAVVAEIKDDKIVHPLTRIEKATSDGFAQVSVAIGDTLASNLAAQLGGRGTGAQIGGSLGGAFGGGFLGKAIEFGGKGVFAAAGNAVVPVVGGLIGTAIGGLVGGLFGHHKKAVDQSTSSIDKLGTAADKAAEQIGGLAEGYKIGYARFLATPAREPGSAGGGGDTGGGGGGGGSTGGGGGGSGSGPTEGAGDGAGQNIVINLHNPTFNGIANVTDFMRSIGSMAEKASLRGGTTGLQLAVGR